MFSYSIRRIRRYFHGKFHKSWPSKQPYFFSLKKWCNVFVLECTLLNIGSFSFKPFKPDSFLLPNLSFLFFAFVNALALKSSKAFHTQRQVFTCLKYGVYISIFQAFCRMKWKCNSSIISQILMTLENTSVGVWSPSLALFFRRLFSNIFLFWVTKYFLLKNILIYDVYTVQFSQLLYQSSEAISNNWTAPCCEAWEDRYRLYNNYTS